MKTTIDCDGDDECHKCGKEVIERIVSIPVYFNDTYQEVAARFLDAFEDDDVLDGFYAESEAKKNPKGAFRSERRKRGTYQV